MPPQPARAAGLSEPEKSVLVGLAIPHNPFVPIDLGAGLLWAALNIGTVACFWVVNGRAVWRL